MNITETARRGLQTRMGKAGILNYEEVATRAGLDPRAVRGLDDRSTLATVAKLAAALGCEPWEILKP